MPASIRGDADIGDRCSIAPSDDRGKPFNFAPVHSTTQPDNTGDSHRYNHCGGFADARKVHSCDTLTGVPAARDNRITPWISSSS